MIDQKNQTITEIVCIVCPNGCRMQCEMTADGAVALASEMSDVIMDLYTAGLEKVEYGDKQTVILNLTVNDRMIALGSDQILTLEKLLFA